MRLDPVISKYAKEHSKEFNLFRRAVERYDRIAIFRHIKPDCDALGAQFGLKTFINDNFPNKEVRVLGDHHVTLTPRVFPDADKLSESWFKEPFLAIVLDVGDHERIADPRYSQYYKQQTKRKQQEHTFSKSKFNNERPSMRIPIHIKPNKPSGRIFIA